MTTDKDITILGLLRGVHFASTVLELAREDVIQNIISTNCFEFFSQIKREIVYLVGTEGHKHAMEIFGITKHQLDSILGYQTPEIHTPKRKRGRRPSTNKQQKVQELVTSSDFISSLPKKKSKGYIVTKVNAVSKAFLVQEAEKISTRFGICENLDVDRTSLKDWVKSYHKTGKLTGSQRKYNLASDTLRKAYDQLISEIEIE
jgi:hypothetical protein